MSEASSQVVMLAKSTLELAQVEQEMRKVAVTRNKGLVRIEISYTGNDSMPIRFTGYLE